MVDREQIMENTWNIGTRKFEREQGPSPCLGDPHDSFVSPSLLTTCTNGGLTLETSTS